MVVDIQPAGVTLYTHTRGADTARTKTGTGKTVVQLNTAATYRSQGSQPATATKTDNQDALTISR